MQRKAPPPRGDGPRPPDPVLAPGAAFAGLVHLREAARIDGRVDGEIIAVGPLWIGETGKVQARIEAEAVVIAGELTGEVWATERIELLATARVTAALHAPRLVLAEGSFFEGHCHAGIEASTTNSRAVP